MEHFVVIHCFACSKILGAIENGTETAIANAIPKMYHFYCSECLLSMLYAKNNNKGWVLSGG
jgi:hypothetical protein